MTADDMETITQYHENASVINKSDATCTTYGYTGDVYCPDCKTTLCKGTKTKPAGHKWDNGVVTASESKENDGRKTYTCTVCKAAKTEVIPHNWKDPTYKWSNDYSTCTATRVCATDSSHKETETVNTTKTTKAATCTAKGSTTYTATFKNTAFAKQTKTVTINATGHSWGKVNYTWSSDHKTCTATRVCAKDASHKETETVKTTSKVKTPATTTAMGVTTYTATFQNKAFTTQTKDVTDIPKLTNKRVPGDANNDGKVDVSDVLFIQQYLAGWDVKINLENADVDGSGKVTVGDVLLIQQKIAGWSVNLK